ncbi:MULTISPECIES: hypothetical protein [Catenuloplanes]|uniref:Uncharacterized protein n=1 Tax=Catenuloplanes niger TaxID=587534 RepID=A0AAE3ZWP7_9ACTN|nr:hypothetical protein [Catenuloplanes niger]MDR7327292.1 hypothetical protein [Catenuloplanes niger]
MLPGPLPERAVVDVDDFRSRTVEHLDVAGHDGLAPRRRDGAERFG